MHTRRTLTLTKDWQLTLDGVGRIALTEGDMATAQAVANQCRLFTEDAYFIQDQGIPHFITELGQGHRPGNVALRAFLRRAALKVNDVKEVLSVDITAFDPTSRTLTGDVRVTTKEGSHGQIRIAI